MTKQGRPLRFLSLFSGIEACSVAWYPLGWECVGVAEIEPFPCAVLAHHYPDVPNLGSVTDITDEHIEALGHIDLVVGGSPCQDLSVAGKRKGLAGARSGLFSEQTRIFHAARRLCGARWLLWENVPGAFSTNGGRDFAAVVGEMAGAGFDVPRNGWQSAGVAAGEHGLVEWCVLDAQGFGVPQRRRRVFALLDSGSWTDRAPVFSEQHRLPWPAAALDPPRPGAPADPGSRFAAGDPIAFDLTQVTSNENRSNPQPGAPTPPLCSNAKPPHIVQAFNVYPESGQGADLCASPTDLAATIDATSTAALTDRGTRNVQGARVRRLTPRECERLQGFPDDYTQIGGAPDLPRYRALGNSMPVPVMRWLGEQVQAAHAMTADVTA